MAIHHSKTESEPKTPDHATLLAAAQQRVNDAVRKLRQMGIIDEKGRRVRTGTPPDMEEGKPRDFGS